MKIDVDVQLLLCTYHYIMLHDRNHVLLDDIRQDLFRAMNTTNIKSEIRKLRPNPDDAEEMFESLKLTGSESNNKINKYLDLAKG
jgi:hypothetical protein